MGKFILKKKETVFILKAIQIYTKMGGILEVYPNVNTIIRKNDLIARIKNIFGNVVEEYYAPCSGIVSVVIFVKYVLIVL